MTNENLSTLVIGHWQLVICWSLRLGHWSFIPRTLDKYEALRTLNLMPPQSLKPTESELQILAVLWQKGPATVREVHDQLGRQTGYTSVLKLMQIMTDKGLV